MLGSASTKILDPSFMTKYGITKVHWIKSGGQKEVYLINRGTEICILKLFKNFGKREIRELEIYTRYADRDGLPKLILEDDFGTDKVVFEHFIEGQPLNEIIGSYKGDFSKIKTLIVNIANLLEPLWNEGIIHRDLKPENIIIRPDGTPVVIDFGIARTTDASLTATGFMPRTHLFCAPEQHRGDKDSITYRTDYFNLGIIAYFLYYQDLPFGFDVDQIKDRFESGNLKYNTQGNCPLNDFFEITLAFNIAERARDTNSLLKTLN